MGHTCKSREKQEDKPDLLSLTDQTLDTDATPNCAQISSEICVKFGKSSLSGYKISCGQP